MGFFSKLLGFESTNSDESYWEDTGRGYSTEDNYGRSFSYKKQRNWKTGETRNKLTDVYVYPGGFRPETDNKDVTVHSYED